MSYFPTITSPADSAGSVLVSSEGYKATYSVALNNSLPTSGIIGVSAYVQGSASKLIKITKIHLSFTLTTAALWNIILFRYSTLPTGGTSSAKTPANLDINDAAPTAVVETYTATPTEGVRNGSIASFHSIAGSATVSPLPIDISFSDVGTKPIYLRGTGDILGVYINAGGAAGSGQAGFIEWTEE